ncbi:MAG: DUF6080 domain-containing protein [Kiritimatiellia bacterium]
MRDSHIRLGNLFAFFSVDVTLHLVIGWGMSEPWIFASHWIFLIPIIIGKGFTGKCKIRS